MCFLILGGVNFGQRRVCPTWPRIPKSDQVFFTISPTNQSRPCWYGVVRSGAGTRCYLLATRPNRAELYRGNIQAHTVTLVFLSFHSFRESADINAEQQTINTIKSGYDEPFPLLLERPRPWRLHSSVGISKFALPIRAWSVHIIIDHPNGFATSLEITTSA